VSTVLVKEVMTQPAQTVREDATVKEALSLLDRLSITALPVVTGRGRIVGVVSEADLIRDAIAPDVRRHLNLAVSETRVLPPHEVGEVMSRHSVTVHPDTDLVEAVELMTTTSVKSLPVVDDHDVVVGVISRRDVVRVLARPDLVLEAEADDLFRRLGLEWLVDVRDGVVMVSGAEGAKPDSVASAVAGSVPGVVGVWVAGS